MEHGGGADKKDHGGRQASRVLRPGPCALRPHASLPAALAGYTVVSATSITDGSLISAITVDANGKQYGLILKLS